MGELLSCMGKEVAATTVGGEEGGDCSVVRFDCLRFAMVHLIAAGAISQGIPVDTRSNCRANPRRDLTGRQAVNAN